MADGLPHQSQASQPAHRTTNNPIVPNNVYGASNFLTRWKTLLLQAFSMMTLHDPSNPNWNMDTSASSHINSSIHNLSTVFNEYIYLSIYVGDDKSIIVTYTDHSILLSLKKNVSSLFLFPCKL